MPGMGLAHKLAQAVSRLFTSLDCGCSRIVLKPPQVRNQSFYSLRVRFGGDLKGLHDQFLKPDQALLEILNRIDLLNREFDPGTPRGEVP